jgi:phage terminase large subunit-like protein
MTATLLSKPTTSPSRGDRVIRFIEQHCVHPDGPWVGQPVRLLDWQKAFLRVLFAVDPHLALRRHRWCLLGG